MQSTVVKHKKDGGLSGGNFDSYNILRVRCNQQLRWRDSFWESVLTRRMFYPVKHSIDSTAIGKGS